jgi:tetratricopeptide (TPR) repeat protein
VAHSLLARSAQERDHSANISLGNSLLALSTRAVAHHQAGRYVEAIRLYEQVLALKFDLPAIHNNLGHALNSLGRPAAADAAFQRAIALKPHNPEALCNWGLALVDLDRLDEAEAKYLQAIRINARFAGAYNNLGLLLKEKGRLPEAKQAFERAIELAPKKFSYYCNLADVRPFVAGDPYLKVIETAADGYAALSVADKMQLKFALAKAYDDLNQPENAFRHLLEANRLKRQQVDYDETATLGLMVRLRELIGRDFIEARQGCGRTSATPVFIVGMPRSGTSLIEQILASHSQIFGAGELLLVDQVAGHIRNLLPGAPPFPEMMLKMSPADFRSIGAIYLDKLAQRASTAMRITDKMTVNFLFLGLIHLALPNATIIHAVRDPADTCVSCFATHFTKGNQHTYDLAELGRYYRHYRNLMAHWHDVLPPGRIMDVHYEDLVADLERVARRIVAHCGLSWDARCLDFHRTERPIRTASASQVRKPIYRDSVGRWRRYHAFLDPLFAELTSTATKAAN